MKVTDLRFTAFGDARRLETVAAGLAILVIGGIAAAFVWQSTLASFADDSVSYLIMAHYLSPYFPAGKIIAAAFVHEHYPPLFPLLLAVTGASHSMLLAHLVVAGCFVASLVMIYLVGRKWFPAPLALMLLLLFAASPAVWRSLLAILSENLYLFLTFLALYLYRTRFEERVPTRAACVWLGVVFAAVLLTRTIGISLILAYIITRFLERRRAGALRLNLLFPVALPLLAALVWDGLHTGDSGRHYVGLLAPEITRVLNAGDSFDAAVHFLTRQMHAFYGGWFASTLGYWRITTPNYFIAALFGLLALVGLGIRVRRNHLDGWYVLIYLAILLFWPFSGQFVRFTYVIYPLLLFHAAIACLALVSLRGPGRAAQRATSLLVLAMLAIVVPSVAFFAGRAGDDQIIGGVKLNRIAEFYYEPQVTRSAELALLHGSLLQDMKRIRRTTPADAVVMWYTPDYISLLAHRRAVALPLSGGWIAWLRAVRATGANFVLLSRLMPRNTPRDGLAVVQFFRPFTQPVWVHRGPQNRSVLSLLLRVEPRQLDQLIAKSQAGGPPADEPHLPANN